ncbi:hypothetical protein MMC06_005683 [Schaereria dolodes]|nr:hypothetical protein [Schaereria dolodes]
MFASARRLIQYVGSVALEDIKNVNHRESVKTFCKTQETADPRIIKAEIKGSNPHKSHSDPTDPENAISVQFLDTNGK